MYLIETFEISCEWIKSGSFRQVWISLPGTKVYFCIVEITRLDENFDFVGMWMCGSAFENRTKYAKERLCTGSFVGKKRLRV